MQPIAVDNKIFKDLFEDWNNFKSQSDYYLLAKKVKMFHQICVDKKDGISYWYKDFLKLKNSLTNQNLRNIFDQTIGPKALKYFPVQLEQITNLLYNLGTKTPDRIILTNEKCTDPSLLSYDCKTFNSDEYSEDCVLYRIPKSINIPPNTIFNDFRILAPFLRDAKSLELCDAYLFKNPQYDDDYRVIFELLKLCKELNSLKIHCQPTEHNILQVKLRDTIKKDYSKVKFEGFHPFNTKDNDVNHDRFLIVDSERLSIRFTSSFNNLRKLQEGCFKAKKAFLIEFSSGRKYYD